MKKRTKLFLTLTFSVFSILCTGAACEKSAKEGPLGEVYDYIFNKPYAATPDDFMSVDGYLDEEVWKDRNYLTQTVDEASWSATTYFTEKGLYVAVEATDLTMNYKTRYTSRSMFNLYVCKSGTPTIHPDNTAYYSDTCQNFQLDPYYCRSKDRVPYYYKAQVNGELNSETECTMTAELFLAWEDLYYTQEELGEKGYPETIQMYITYEGTSKEVLGSCSWREETYFYYNENGLIGTINHQDLGNAKNGLAATDQWTVNEDGKLQTTAGRTQIVWLKNACSKNFMFEAELRPLGNRTAASGATETISLRGSKVSGRFGLIHAIRPTADATTTISGYTIYSADARSISDQSVGNKSIKVQTYRQTDSFHWANLIGLSQKTVETGYTEESVILRVIKEGDMFHYFFNDTYWQSERIANLQEEVYCGIYTSQGVVIEDYKFVDYAGDENELQSELEKYMYFIDVAGEMTRGSVLTNGYTVPKGKPVTITFAPKMQSILTDIKIGQTKQSAVSVFDKIYPLLNENNEYTFTPTEDVYIGAEYTSFPKESNVKVIMNFVDEDGVKAMDANFEIRGSDKRMYYKGTPNTSGNIIANLPKKGTYMVGKETIEVSGIYELKVTFSGHHTYTTTFTLDENTQYDSKGQFILDATVLSNAWGTVVVNGKTVSGNGTLQFNSENGNYYTDGSVKRYFKDTVAENFVANITLSMTQVGNRNGDLMGVAITDGSKVLVIKYNLENRGKVIIATGNGVNDSVAGREYAITGFDYTKVQEPYGVGGNGYGELSIKIVKCGNAIYLFNSAGVLKAYFNENGVHLVNGAALSWGASESNKTSINNDVKSILTCAESKQVALGLFTYKMSSIRAEIEMDFSTLSEGIYTDEIGCGALTISLSEDRTLATETYPVREYYGMGEIVELGVKVADAENAKMRMIIVDQTGVRMIEGVYDWASKSIVFKFEYGGGDTIVSTAIIEDGDMDWSKDWGNYEPDRDATDVEREILNISLMEWDFSWFDFIPNRENTLLD